MNFGALRKTLQYLTEFARDRRGNQFFKVFSSVRLNFDFMMAENKTIQIRSKNHLWRYPPLDWCPHLGEGPLIAPLGQRFPFFVFLIQMLIGKIGRVPNLISELLVPIGATTSFNSMKLASTRFNWKTSRSSENICRAVPNHLATPP